jgi:hypothetical protein
MCRTCSTHGRNAYNILVGKQESKRPLQIRRSRWEDEIKMYLEELIYEGVDWIYLAQDRDQWQAFVNTIINFGYHKKRIIS